MGNSPLRDTVMLTTPHGHEVLAELDYEAFALSHARVVNHYTGVIKQLDGATAETLARALKAKQVYEHALAESRAAEQALNLHSNLTATLGKDHPAVAPYWREAEQHRAIARDMFTHACHFHDTAMHAIDRLIGD